MSETVLKVDLLRSLGRLVRGLSALFWGLPIALVVCVQTAKTDWLKPLGFFPPLAATALLYYGLSQLSHFQKQERPWMRALDRAKLLGLINVGLAPFLYWWNLLPRVLFYNLMIGILALSALLFVFNLNLVLQRLTAMLPDETLRTETRLFTTLNLYLLLVILLSVLAVLTIQRWVALPPDLTHFLLLFEPSRPWLILLLVLLPVAMTMALLWKVKEVVLASVFESEN